MTNAGFVVDIVEQRRRDTTTLLNLRDVCEWVMLESRIGQMGSRYGRGGVEMTMLSVIADPINPYK